MFSGLVGKNCLFGPFLINMFSGLGVCAPHGQFGAMHFVGRKAWQIASSNPFLLLPPCTEVQAGMTLDHPWGRIALCPAGRGRALGPANRLAESGATSQPPTIAYWKIIVKRNFAQGNLRPAAGQFPGIPAVIVVTFERLTVRGGRTNCENAGTRAALCRCPQPSRPAFRSAPFYMKDKPEARVLTGLW